MLWTSLRPTVTFSCKSVLYVGSVMDRGEGIGV